MICAKPLPKVLVIHALQLVGKGLCELLARAGAFDVLGDLCDVAALEDLHVAPDLIVLGIDAMGAEAGDAVRACKAALPDARICTLTAFGREDVLQRCLAAGADGFIVKDASPAEFVRAARAISDGQSYVDPRVAGTLLRRRSVATRQPGPETLSQREFDIVCLIAGGLSNREISARLALSEKTVKNYISRIFAKLNVTARTQAAAFAYKTGMV